MQFIFLIDICMKEQIEQLTAQIQELKCRTEKEIEDARVRLLGKKGEITRLFEEFRTVSPEVKREFGQKLNVLKKLASDKIQELKAEVAVSASAAAVYSCEMISCRRAI